MIATMLVCLALGLLLIGLAFGVRRVGRRRWPRISLATSAALAVVGIVPLALGVYLLATWLAGQPSALACDYGPGVTYRRLVLTTPNRAVVHVMEIPRSPGRRLVVTPPVETPDGLRNLATVATAAVRSLDADVVINASFFTPFRDNYVLDAYPGRGDPIEPIGPVVSGGIRYGRPKADWPSVWQDGEGRIVMGQLPAGVTDAVTGRQFLLRGGNIAIREDEPPYPRTAIATDASGERLWLVVVDGKQPRYSDGLSLSDLAKLLQGLGATDAIELDGGGSSVMVMQTPGGVHRLSRPCHTKVPGRLRPTGVFLGVKWER